MEVLILKDHPLWEKDRHKGERPFSELPLAWKEEDKYEFYVGMPSSPMAKPEEWHIFVETSFSPQSGLPSPIRIRNPIATPMRWSVMIQFKKNKIMMHSSPSQLIVYYINKLTDALMALVDYANKEIIENHAEVVCGQARPDELTDLAEREYYHYFRRINSDDIDAQLTQMLKDIGGK